MTEFISPVARQVPYDNTLNSGNAPNVQGMLDLIIAPWIGTRYYAVDYDNGVDTNAGFSDASLAAAGTVAIKTLERLHQILPRSGNGQRAVVAIRARSGGATYRNAANSADDMLDFSHSISNYEQLIIRGTDTVASANTVAFSDDAADQVVCGAMIVSGTNSGGYNPTGSPTASVISCQINGGGAASLTAEPALLGKRVRFRYDTATVALRNAVGMVWSNTSSQITLATDLSTAPSTSDIFYIEEPGAAAATFDLSSNSSDATFIDAFTNAGFQMVGLKFTGSTAPVLEQRGGIAYCNFSFISAPNTTSFSAFSAAGAVDFRVQNIYTNASGTTIATGAGFESEGSLTATNCKQVIATHMVTRQARPQILNINVFSVGSSSVSAGGIILQNCGSPPALTNLGSNNIGNSASATNRRFRSTGVNVTEAISITRSSVLIYGVDITGAGSSPLISIKGIGQSVSIQDVVGSTGNTGVGLDLTLARDCHILMGSLAANTFAAAANQDISCITSVFYVHADYARTDLKDAYANHIQGSANSILGTVTLAANDANANIGQYKICRATATNAVRAAFATTAAGAAGIVGVSQSAFTTTQSAMLCNGGGTWIQFDAGPTAGNIAYLSNATAGNAMDAPPTLLSVTRKIRLGRILRVSGTLGFVAWSPEILSVLADGAA